MSFGKTIIGLVVVILLAGAIFYFRSPKVDNSQPASNTSTADSQTQDQKPMDNTPTPTPTPVPSKPVAVVETSLGTFEITLEDKAAPKTVANFEKLIKDSFYNNLTFHRVVKQTGFHLIQGGDPNGDGSGGPGYTVPAEIGLKHTRGAVATARTGDQVNPTKASSGSQFYIVEEDIPFLDGNYTVFGYVTKGMDVVDKIGRIDTGPNDRPLTPVIINKITLK